MMHVRPSLTSMTATGAVPPVACAIENHEPLAGRAMSERRERIRYAAAIRRPPNDGNGPSYGQG
eukprot:CAMPEP_0170430880 /NCGR_PEP_ID=MMETSP0117_2-20130122/41094_1 /TAXON_ID=400756 /ORGANISM="Durinskia baltica, Strain CSIRO CS-38" /LENGTH=63 /DNA_ID=CAMNT_0010690379 /DNA_START=30 /DNA_END=218 /DNA_ORIENTATION=-